MTDYPTLHLDTQIKVKVHDRLSNITLGHKLR